MWFIAIPDLAAAVVVAVFILAALTLAAIASHVIPNVPIIGSAIRNAIVGAIRSVVGWAEAALSDLLVPVAAVLMWSALLTWWVIYYTVTGITHGVAVGRAAEAYAKAGLNSLAGAVRADYYAALHYADAKVNSLAGALRTDYAALEGFTVREVDALAGALRADVAAVEGFAVAQVDDLAGALRADVAGLEGDISKAYDAAIANASSMVDDLAGAVRADVASLEGDITTAYNAAVANAGATAAAAAAGAIAGLDAAVHDVVIGPWDALLGDATTVVDALPAELAQLLGLPATLPHDLPLDLAGILSLVVPVVGAVTAETARCSVPMCRNLGGLSNLFAALTDAGLYGALLALLAEVATDPAGAVADVEAVAGPICADTATAFRAVVGV